MNKFNFDKYKKGIIRIEIHSIMPEKFINLLWKNNVYVKNIKKINITTVAMDINLKDYDMVQDISKRTNTKIRIINRKGISFFMIKTRKRKTLVGGIVIFAGMIYFLSTYIWFIDITTEKNITPFELRNQLKTSGIVPGINKRKIDVYELEEKIVKDNEDIMWARARVQGARLKINIAERQEPPKIEVDDSPCDIVAKKDGEIVRVYSKGGTSVVKKGDIVKKGDMLVKGEQGKENSLYPVHAEADVIAKTFYEKVKEVSNKEIERVRTGKKQTSVYLNIFGKNIHLKKIKNNFKNYDKIVIDKSLIKQEVYYEVDEKIKVLDKDYVIKDTAQELFSEIIVKLDKSVKIVDKIVDVNQVGQKYSVRVVLVVEENIAETQTREMENDNNAT